MVLAQGGCEMRRFILPCLFLAACGVSEERAARPTVWDHRDVVWSDRPVIVVTKPEGLYPDAPDVELSLTCRADGGVMLGGDVTKAATDIGSIPSPGRMGLRAGGEFIDAPANWANHDFEANAAVALSPRPGQLRKLLTSGPLTVTRGDGANDEESAVEYPAPPRAMTETFLRRCGA